MLKHVKDQVKGNKLNLEKKLELRRDERSAENRSKTTRNRAKASPKEEI